MLLDTNNTKIQLIFQQYICKNFRFENNNTEFLLDFFSVQNTDDVICQYCENQNVEVHDNYTTKLIDIPDWPGIKQFLSVTYHKYKCRCCKRVFNEDICFKDPDSRVTSRAATVTKQLLSYGLPITSISRFTGMHWDTIRKIHTNVMEEALETRKKFLREKGYKPTFLAVDEFAIHKGHTYATCVMDLETGDVLWVGKGRGAEDFRKFFTEYDMDYLSNVEAFAMDMNASYNKLVEEYMPKVKIVYDRYHMQAQFGKEVLGVVRLDEARKHRDIANDIKEIRSEETDPEIRRKLKQEYKEERKKYNSIKRSRWSILTNSNNLSENKKTALESILEEHNNLAICYAMKEEMCRLFEIRDIKAARTGWTAWFAAAKESKIEALVHFAELKEKRLEGLISHASYPISTGKLEGLNNKIKVAKRVGYGFRNDDYFFILVRYISLPHSFMLIPQKT